MTETNRMNSKMWSTEKAVPTTESNEMVRRWNLASRMPASPRPSPTRAAIAHSWLGT
jgi:hypothetical protein